MCMYVGITVYTCLYVRVYIYSHTQTHTYKHAYTHIPHSIKMNSIIGILHYKPNSISLNRVAVFPISTAFEKHCRLIGTIHFLFLPKL